jgi:hypothetical protein
VNRHARFLGVSIVCLLVLASWLAPVPVSAQLLSDPYEIINRHYEAMGGLENLKAEKTRHFEATVSVMGLEGTVKNWEESPLKKRQEVDLTIFKQTEGDNGEYAWAVDQNGKLQIKKDEVTLKKRQVEALMSEFRHLERDSKVFTLTLDGVERMGDAEYYVIRLANNINEDVRIDYINTITFMADKAVVITPSIESYMMLSDVRSVGAVKVPFRHEGEIKPMGQKQTIQITKYESNVPIDPTVFEPPGEGAEDFTFAEGTSAEDIPFQYIGDHLFVEVTVNCDKHLWVLDTGAGATVIDSAYAAGIGLAPAGDLKAMGAGKTVAAAFVSLPGFSVAGIEFGEQKVVSINIDQLFKRAGLKVAGILGYDFLSRFVTKVDYANRKISFYHPDSFKYTGSGTAVDAPLRENIFALPMEVDGKYGGMWGLDLGASGTSFHYSYAEKNGILDRKGLEAPAGGAGGYFMMRASKYDSALLAGFTLGEQVISVPLEKSGAFGAREETGNLGNDILRHFVIYLDYANQRVIFEKGADFDKDFPEGKSGLGMVVADDGTYQVFFVVEGTPAARAGLMQGDVVRKINGIPATSFASLVAIQELFKADEGTVYTLEISREGRTRQVKMRLKDLM